MYSSPRLGLYGSMPWIGPDSKLPPERGRRAGVFFVVAFLTTDCLVLTVREVPFLLDVFFEEAFFAGFFLVAFFFVEVFLVDVLRLTDFFLAAFFFAGFFFAVDFLAVTFFLEIFFLLAAFFRLEAAAFFLVTLRFFDAGLRAAAFLAVAFFLEAGAFFRFLLAVFFAVFFAGIVILLPDREKAGIIHGLPLHGSLFFVEICLFRGGLSFCRDNRFICLFHLH